MALRSCICRAISRASLAYGAPTFNTLPSFTLHRFPTTFSESTSLPGSSVNPFFTTSIRAYAAGDKKSGSAAKRARQSEERRIRNKSRKSLIKTRLKKDCLVCHENKGENVFSAGLLQPLSIPSQKWESISMDFITGLPKVFRALDELKVSSSPSPEDIKPIDTLISKAQSAIDKAVKCGTVHKNTGARKKARLARRKTAIKIHLGLNKPETASGV